MNKAIFLDRDGVINRDALPYTFRIEDFFILDGVYDALKLFQKKNYLLIVISNQGGIGKNIYSKEDAERVIKFMNERLNENGIFLSEVYYCPHHPSKGNCICRKPDSLLIEKGLARFEIDPMQSYFIGDMDRDIQAAAKAGVKGIKIKVNSNLASIIHLIK